MIEKGDILALKGGQEVEVLSVKMDGNDLRRFDYVDRGEESPMRRTEYPSAILRLIRKGTIKQIDPMKQYPHDQTLPKEPLPIIPHNPNQETEPNKAADIEDKSNSTPKVKPILNKKKG